MQSALRIGMVPAVLDSNQFPGYSDHPVPMRRRDDAGRGRLEGGNARRPPNSYLHEQMGIAFPPGVSEEDGYNGREYQDEDAYEASRTNFFPRDSPPPRRHLLVNRRELEF